MGSLSSVDFYEQRVVCEVQAFNGFVVDILNVFYRIKNSLIGSNYESANVIVQTYLRVAIQRWYFFFVTILKQNLLFLQHLAGLFKKVDIKWFEH